MNHTVAAMALVLTGSFVASAEERPVMPIQENKFSAVIGGELSQLEAEQTLYFSDGSFSQSTFELSLDLSYQWSNGLGLHYKTNSSSGEIDNNDIGSDDTFSASSGQVAGSFRSDIVGIAAGIGGRSTTFDQTFVDDFEIIVGTAFVEGALYFEHVTFRGTVAASNVEYDDFFNDTELTGVNVSADLFATEDIRFGIDISSGTASEVRNNGVFFNEERDYGFGRLAGDFEVILPQTSLSIFSGLEFSRTDEFEYDAVALQLGVRYYFGQNTLRSFDRYGASVEGGNFLFDTYYLQ